MTLALAAAANHQDRAFTVNGSTRRATPFVAKVDDEYVIVTGGSAPISTAPYPTPTSQTWQVERGMLGSEIADHDNGATVDVEPTIGGGATLLVDNGVDAPVAAARLVAPGAVFEGDQATIVPTYTGSTPPSNGVNQGFSVEPQTSFDGGTFKLTWDGEETNAIAWDATIGDILAALEALPNIGVGNIEIDNTDPDDRMIDDGEAPFVFVGDLGYQPLEIPSVSDDSLTGGGGGSNLDVTENDTGAASDPAMPPHGATYFDLLADHVYVNIGTGDTPNWQPVGLMSQPDVDAIVATHDGNAATHAALAAIIEAAAAGALADHAADTSEVHGILEASRLDTKDVFAPDPSAGAGVDANPGSIYRRNNAGVGELWVKTGGANTAWSKVTTS